MAHAGTMMGGSAQTKQGGSPWPAIALTIAVIVATVAGVWLASSAGLVRGTAKPAAGQAYDQYLNGVLDRAHAAPYTGSRSRRWPMAAWSAPRVIPQQASSTVRMRAPFARRFGAATLSYVVRPYALHAHPRRRNRAHAGVDERRYGPPYQPLLQLDRRITQFVRIDAYLNGILDRAHATPYAAGRPDAFR